MPQGIGELTTYLAADPRLRTLKPEGLNVCKLLWKMIFRIPDGFGWHYGNVDAMKLYKVTQSLFGQNNSKKEGGRDEGTDCSAGSSRTANR